MSSRVDGESVREPPDVSVDRGDLGDPGTADQRWPRDPVVWALALLGLFVLGILLARAARIADPDLTNRLASAATVPGGLLAVSLAFRAGRLERLDPGTRRAWTLMSVAFTSFFAGSLLHFFAASLPGTSVLLYLVTILELAAYPMAAVAVVMLPKTMQPKSDSALFALDTAIVAWSAAMLLWHFVLSPIADESGADLLAAIGAATYPVFDLAFLFGVVAVILRGVRPSSQAALTFIAVALLPFFVGAMISGIETLRGTHTPVSYTHLTLP